MPTVTFHSTTAAYPLALPSDSTRACLIWSCQEVTTRRNKRWFIPFSPNANATEWKDTPISNALRIVLRPLAFSRHI